MNCQKCKIEIEERAPRRERLSDAATAHLSACASCRVFEAERLALSRLVGGLEKVSAPADFDFRMRARMAAASSVSAPRSRRFNFSPAALSWPLAACFALVISATLYFQPRPQPPVLTDTPTEQAGQARATAAATAATPTPQASESEATSQSAPVKLVETRHSIDALASKTALDARRRALPVRAPGAATTEAAQIRVALEESTSASVLGAPMKYDGRAQGEGASIPVQVSAQERPLKVLLRETGGTARTISVESVSFGSRDVIGRPATISKASLSTNQGVW
jgi:hypothetical protein